MKLSLRVTCLMPYDVKVLLFLPRNHETLGITLMSSCSLAYRNGHWERNERQRVLRTGLNKDLHPPQMGCNSQSYCWLALVHPRQLSRVHVLVTLHETFPLLSGASLNLPLRAKSLRDEPLFVGLAYQGKDIVFRFSIEYSSLRDFCP
jgi:hypothetical protein